VLETKFLVDLFFSSRVLKKDTFQQQRAGIKKRKLFLADNRMGLFGSDRCQGSGERNIIQNVL
jgi:hypothetical protein